MSRRVGQAAVELVAVVPIAVLLLAAGVQLALSGQAAWLAADAARSASRALALGKDAKSAAKQALPDRLEHDLKVEDRSGGRVLVTVSVPFLATSETFMHVNQVAQFEPQSEPVP